MSTAINRLIVIAKYKDFNALLLTFLFVSALMNSTIVSFTHLYFYCLKGYLVLSELFPTIGLRARTLRNLYTKREEGNGSDFTGLCCWPGWWSSRLISHSLGWNASRITTVINRRSDSEGGWSIITEKKEIKESSTLSWMQVLAIKTSWSYLT